MPSISTKAGRIVAAVAAATLVVLAVLVALRLRRRASVGDDESPPAASEETPPSRDGSSEDQEPQEPFDDALVAREASAAAAEAAMIGGVVSHEVDDPAMAPVYEAGGGEQEGWEAAERALTENATHGDGGGDPLRDAIAPEIESDASGAVYGEADRIPSTEVVEDPAADPDDPGRGPGLASERGPGLQPRQEP
jgi:hypothetical protein